MKEQDFIHNKVITVDQIIEIANFLDSYKNEYNRLISEDKKRNEGKPYSEQVYYYNGSLSTIKYHITNDQGVTNTSEDQFWFLDTLKKEPQYIKDLRFEYSLSYTDSHDGWDNRVTHHLYYYFSLYLDHVHLSSSQENMSEELYKLNSYIQGVLNKGEDRYSKIVKYKDLIKVLFSLTIGFAFSYIVIILMLLFKGDSESFISQYVFGNSFVFLIFQWFVAAASGSIFGIAIMNDLYSTIVPEKRYKKNNFTGNYDYKDDIEEYTNRCELQLGVNANNKEKRATIAKIYDISKKVVLGQILVSAIIFIIMSII